MPINAGLLLQGRAPDTSNIANMIYSLGQQRQQNERNEPMLELERRLLEARAGVAGEQLTPEAIEGRRLQRQYESLAARDQIRLQRILPAAKQMKSLISAGDADGAKLLAGQRMADLQQRREAGEEIDDVETAGFLRILDTNPEQAESYLDSVLRFEGVASKDAASKAFAPVTLVNPETNEKVLAAPTFNPNTGQAELSKFDVPKGFEISTETPEEKRAAEVVTAGEKTRVVEETKAGVAAQTKPELERAITGAREYAKAEAAKITGQQGQKGKIEEARSLHSDLSSNDLDLIYGKGESYLPGFLRSQRGIDLIAKRDQLVSMLVIGARGELAGQGPITDAEQGMLANSATLLNNPEISPKAAKIALDRAMNVLLRGAGDAEIKSVGAGSRTIDELVNKYANP